MNNKQKRRWVAIDWGTTSLRAWLLSPDGEVLDHAASNQGMSALQPAEFEPALLALTATWLTSSNSTTIVACGMVGAKQGWIEANYTEVPCNPLSTESILKVPTKDTRIDVHIVPGISQRVPADVMRGEETQLAGFLATHKDFSGSLCLPGTHTKWASINNGLITHFSTYMTGELYSLLGTQSILKHNVHDSQWQEDVFIQHVTEAFENPGSMTSMLFRIRAESLLFPDNGNASSSALSGILIGAELNSVCQKDDRYFAIIGPPELSKHYQVAMKGLSIQCTVENTEKMTLAGLCKAHDVITTQAITSRS